MITINTTVQAAAIITVRSGGSLGVPTVENKGLSESEIDEKGQFSLKHKAGNSQYFSHCQQMPLKDQN